MENRAILVRGRSGQTLTPPPCLGRNLTEIHRGWQSVDPGPGRRTAGWAAGLGRYDYYAGQLHRLCHTVGVSTHRPATADEQAQVDQAICRGWFQIEAVPQTGLIGGQGGHGTLAGSLSVIVLHQATGQPLQESSYVY